MSCQVSLGEDRPELAKSSESQVRLVKIWLVQVKSDQVRAKKRKVNHPKSSELSSVRSR